MEPEIEASEKVTSLCEIDNAQRLTTRRYAPLTPWSARLILAALCVTTALPRLGALNVCRPQQTKAPRETVGVIHHDQGDAETAHLGDNASILGRASLCEVSMMSDAWEAF